MQVKFKHAKSTKNTEVFEEVAPKGEPPVVGTLYLKKFAHEKLGAPTELVVTVEAVTAVQAA